MTSFFNLRRRGARSDDGCVGQHAQERKGPGSEMPKSHRQWGVRDAACAADESGEIVGKELLSAGKKRGDAGNPGTQREGKQEEQAADFREAIVGGGSGSASNTVSRCDARRECGDSPLNSFRRKIRDEDAIGAGACGAESEFSRTICKVGLVVDEEGRAELR